MNTSNPFDRLEQLTRKRRVLINRKERLEEVALNPDGNYTAILWLEGSNGNEFTIARPTFLQRFYSELHAGYVQKIQAIEQQIIEHKHNNY